MNEFLSSRRTVVFVDGYSTREVLLDDDGRFVDVGVPTPLAPVELLHCAALLIGDSELTGAVAAHP